MTIITRHYDENGREIQIDTDDSIVMSVSEQVDLMNRICEVRNENDRLKEENRKLRAMVHDMHMCIEHEGDCEDCEGMKAMRTLGMTGVTGENPASFFCYFHFRSLMRKLGIEAG